MIAGKRRGQRNRRAVLVGGFRVGARGIATASGGWRMRLEDHAGLQAKVRGVFLRLIGLGRYPKRAILVVADLLLLGLALWLALSLRLGELFVAPSWEFALIFCAAPVIGVATFFQLGLYRLVTRYIGASGAGLIVVAVVLSALFWALLVLLSGITGVPRSVVILYPVIGAALVWGTRRAAGWLLAQAGIALPAARESAKSVLIYGAGTAGVQLLEALRHGSNYVPIGFIDTSATLWGQYVGGIKVYRPERMAALIENNDIREVLLALPKARRRERQQALRQLETLSVAVRTLPALEDLASGSVTVSDLRPVGAEDLLGRDPVPPDAALLRRTILERSVMVTGAGGSIGAELVRQILRYGPPRVLVLLEASEAQLHLIQSEIEETLFGRRAAPPARERSVPRVAAVLGSVEDGELLRRTIDGNGVQAIFHAAAHKHVPIVEHNPVAGLRNNTFGTATLAEAAERCGVERFVLISTDKAVRPTSIMGASKRLAEMILQARAAARPRGTVFTMVRFGNVLDSSGSVVRTFRRQIEAGGPVTVTHPDAIRYFMSIPEAAALVVQAGAMASGGEVFVLDMGEPVRIDDLARSMIRLMGLEVRDARHADGDIAIDYIGLRPGEKMHEELLLGENITPTEHPRILKSHEPCLPAGELTLLLKELAAAMDANDTPAIRAVLARAVEGYGPEPHQRGPGGVAPGVAPEAAAEAPPAPQRVDGA
jgi:FlaA1/EpsC-like NDP-sugar epimerase